MKTALNGDMFFFFVLFFFFTKRNVTDIKPIPSKKKKKKKKGEKSLPVLTGGVKNEMLDPLMHLNVKGFYQAPDSETSLMTVSSLPNVSNRLELPNNNWASRILHPSPSESDVYNDVIQEVQSNDLLHTVRLTVRLDTPLNGNNARGAK